jgi:hypothetical protein
MTRLIQLLLLLIVAFAVLLVLAIRYLPWWGSLLFIAGTFGGLYLFFRFAFGRILQSIFLIPFKAKGAVLRNASVQIHSVEFATAPERQGDDDNLEEGNDVEENEKDADDENHEDEDDGGNESPAQDFYRIDVTISPTFRSQSFRHWEPSELLLMPANANPTPDADYGSSVSDVELFHNGAFGPDEAGKYFGPQRVRILFEVPIDFPRRVKFRYYFESFSEFVLPPKSEPTTS